MEMGSTCTDYIQNYMQFCAYYLNNETRMEVDTWHKYHFRFSISHECCIINMGAQYEQINNVNNAPFIIRKKTHYFVKIADTDN